MDRLERTSEEMAKGLRVLAMRESTAAREDVKEDGKDVESEAESRGRIGEKSLKGRKAQIEKIAKTKARDTAVAEAGRGGMSLGATAAAGEYYIAFPRGRIAEPVVVNGGGGSSKVESVGAESSSPSSSAGYSAKPQLASKTPTNPPSSEPKPATIPSSLPAQRLGVDDSGAWTFHLNPIPPTSIPQKGAGWRLATIVHSRSHAEIVQGKGFGYS